MRGANFNVVFPHLQSVTKLADDFRTDKVQKRQIDQNFCRFSSTSADWFKTIC